MGKFSSLNAPPRDEPWLWITREIMESPAWAALPLASRRVIDRLMLEHMAHAGTENGNLKVSYDQFAEFGVRRKTLPEAIRIAIELGFIDRVSEGVVAYGAARRPAAYGLAWLYRADRTPPMHRWKNIRTIAQAEEIVAASQEAARDALPARKAKGVASPRASLATAPLGARSLGAPQRLAIVPITRDIEDGGENAPRRNGGNALPLGAKTPPAVGAKTPPVLGAKTPLEK